MIAIARGLRPLRGESGEQDRHLRRGLRRARERRGVAALGHDVTIRDIVPERVDDLRAGRVPIYEPSSRRSSSKPRSPRVHHRPRRGSRRRRRGVRLRRHAGDVFRRRGSVGGWTVLDDLEGIASRPVLVMKSTVPVGTGEKSRRRSTRGVSTMSRYVSNPEFLAEGRAIQDFMNPDRIVIGSDDEAAGDVVEGLHAGLDAPVVRMDVPSAEMVKLAANAFSPLHQLHQRDRQRLRGHRRGRRGGRTRHWPRPPPRAALPARRDWLRRQLLSERRVL